MFFLEKEKESYAEIVESGLGCIKIKITHVHK